MCVPSKETTRPLAIGKATSLAIPQMDTGASSEREAKRTFAPPFHLVVSRGAVEVVKVLLPAGMSLTTVLVPLEVFALQLDQCGAALVCPPPAHPPAVIIGLGAIAMVSTIAGFFLATVALKWLLVGRYIEERKPLWSLRVWLNELITSLCENYVFPWLATPFLGTILAPELFRILGAKFGKDVWLNTTGNRLP